MVLMMLIQIYSKGGLAVTRTQMLKKNMVMLAVEIPLVLSRGSAQSTASYTILGLGDD